ncbi:MAG TPA: hypothetical protein VG126_18450, partial [Thermoleophilaceae bacterium]|nr:hypothetical protein [Thermoleophilaceae bacterium]
APSPGPSPRGPSGSLPRARPARRGHAPPAARTAPLPRGARILDALLTGRLWIGLVGVLLAGIVFFNVDLLQMNREITQMADRATQLKRQNDRLRHDYARLASSERIQEAAAALGLVYPAAGEVRYLESDPKIDAHKASKRIIPPADSATPAPTQPTEITPTDPAATIPATTTTIPPATTVPPTTTTTLSPE